MSYCSRTYRHRNAHTAEDSQNQEPFFSKVHEPNKSTGKNSFFQAKLSINQPGDSYEKEADAVANSVVNGSSGNSSVQQKRKDGIQRLSTDKEDEKLGTNDARIKRDKDIQQKPMEAKNSDDEKKDLIGIQKFEGPIQEEEMTISHGLQKKGNGGSLHSTPSPQLSSKIENSSGKGDPIPNQVMNDMNDSFGFDFSRVKIHKDADAANMNGELQSKAFTHGHDIFFNEGKYNPDSSDGKFLLAHELTHVLQQEGLDENKISAKTDENNFPFPGRVDEPSAGEFLIWNFAIGSDSLKVEHQKELPRIINSIKSVLKENDNSEIDIEGLASSSGSAKANDELSKRRSNSVQKALVAGGVPSAKLKITSSGASKSFPDTTPENMARSRGVRVIPVLRAKLSGRTGGFPTIQTTDCNVKMIVNMSLNGGDVLLDRTSGFLTMEAGDGGSNPGMEISATAILNPSGCGDIEFVQNVQPYREIVYKDGSRNRFSSATMILDGGDPFGSQKTIQDTGTLITKFTADSPAQRIDTLFTEPIVQTIEARDEFKTYILFKPK
ncbi:MAG TPA: DUF4157 domain-containing protein, partial [Puia sp.]|nr:DUF4157 domain-containing protein [Puia sp.]